MELIKEVDGKIQVDVSDGKARVLELKDNTAYVLCLGSKIGAAQLDEMARTAGKHLQKHGITILFLNNPT